MSALARDGAGAEASNLDGLSAYRILSRPRLIDSGTKWSVSTLCGLFPRILFEPAVVYNVITSGEPGETLLYP